MLWSTFSQKASLPDFTMKRAAALQLMLRMVLTRLASALQLMRPFSLLPKFGRWKYVKSRSHWHSKYHHPGLLSGQTMYYLFDPHKADQMLSDGHMRLLQ